MMIRLQQAKSFLLFLASIFTTLLFSAPPASAVGTATANFSFPTTTGVSILYSQGPHGAPNQPITSAIDLVPSDHLVRAAASGTIHFPAASCHSTFIIYHSSGWVTGYAHIANTRVREGQSVQRGDLLGNSSTTICPRESATGEHVHMWVKHNNNEVDLHGLIIGGWYIRPADNCLVRLRDSAIICPGGRLASENITGFGAPTASPPVRSGTCSGTGCNNQPPASSGCWNNSVQTPKQAAIRNRSGTQIGTVQLKWATGCQTNWGAIYSSIGAQTIYETVMSRSGGPFVDLDDYTYGYSPMIYAPNTQARACGGLIAGDFVTGYACTDWY